MSKATGNDRIDDVSPGDIITVGERSGRVVFVDSTDGGYTVTIEADRGETFQLDLPAGTTVTRSLESKWESSQSPTPHAD
ncbi:hypothetical protein MSAS_08690 [Mycobacterium saskatchewanense]|uniref:Oxidoreductase n=1 Tax=Mycobacterium saskatchewanense TaxID=220927 RepID=A0AAJ3TTS1_9MYCO|nr:hypothetical protein [Mycobacterium saskatchewanense]ORW69043.1 oxidoreductase [Mycobacterium saskatchewanense]BBX61695.1 hypothetical protein MSAS_08690 [Mycobacterium saskatchewanense]